MGERNHIARASQCGWLTATLLLGVAIGAGVAAAGPPQGKAASSTGQPKTASGKSSNSASAGRSADDPSVTGTASGEPIVARVNNQVITYKALAEECIARKGPEVLDTIISKMLVMQACQEKGIKVTALEIDEEIGRTAERLRMTREQYLKVLQDERGIPYKRYAEDIVWPGLALKKLATPFVKVTQEEIEHGFEAHYGEKVKCRWITFDDQQNATRVWNDLQNSAQQGKCELAEFERQVSRWSTDVGTRSIGGQIQPIAHHMSPTFQELEKAAFGLRADGEISRVLRVRVGTGESFVILYREGRIAPTAVKLEDVRSQIEAEIYDAKLRDQIGGIFRGLQQNATIENLLTGEIHGPTQSRAESDKPGQVPDAPAQVGGTREGTKKSQPTIRR